MTAMPTIQTPEGFLAECQRRGIKLTAKDGTIKASGKPPANPEKFAAFLKSKKPELLALLENNTKARPVAGEPSELAQVGAGEGGVLERTRTDIQGENQTDLPAALERIGTHKRGEFAKVRNESGPELVKVGEESTPQLEEVGTESPHVFEQNGTENRQGNSRETAGGLKHIETVSTPQLAQVGAVSQIAVVVAWACSEARRGFLPEPAEALPLPSGQSVAPNGAAVWLIAAESRSVGLRSHAKAFPDCALALCIVQRDMEAIATWARHARLWEDAPYTHKGASSPLCAGACDPLEKKMMKGKS